MDNENKENDVLDIENSNIQNKENDISNEVITNTEVPETSEIENITNTSIENLNNEFNNKPKNTSIKVVLSILVIAIIALIGACAYAFSGGVSKGEKFAKVLFDDYILETPMEIAKMAQNDGIVESEICVDADSIISQILGDEVEKIGKISIVENQVKKGNDASSIANLKIDEQEIVSLELAKTGETIGLAIPELFNEYIAIENNNLKALAEKLGLDSEEIPNKITIDGDKKVEKYQKIWKSYKPVFFKAINNFVEIEKNVEIEIDDEKINATRYTLGITNEAALKIVKPILEKAQNDKELYELIKEYLENSYTYSDEISFEEWQEDIKESIEQLNENIVEEDYEPGIIKLSAYQEAGNTVAIEFKLEEFEYESDASILLTAENEKDESNIELIIEADEAKIGITLETEKSKVKYESELKIYVKEGSTSINLKLLDLKTEFKSGNTDGLKTINVANSFILNDASEEEIENKMNEIEKALPSYLLTVMGRLPENILALLNDANYDDENDYGEDYDFDDYEENHVFELEGPQVKVLDELKALYNKVELGKTRAEIISIMGEPDDINDIDTVEFLDWNHDEFDNYYVSVLIEDGKVVDKTLNVYSDSYNCVELSSELNTTITDLHEKIGSVKDGMTFTEVTGILGNGYFEIVSDDFGYHEYMWYDMKENNVAIGFDDENKVEFIGMVLESY